jgi:putative ABC transport system permease protein
MKTGTLTRMVVVALSRNRVRTFLSLLGVAIGVGAVVSMVAVGEGATARVRDQIASLGANSIWIEAGSANRAGVRTGSFGTKSLVLGDAEAIKTQIPFVTNISPQVDTGVQVIYGNQNWRSTVRGESPEYLASKEWAVVLGECFTDQDVRAAANVCVLGQTVWKNLFVDEDPINKIIRVKGLPCKVVGVLAKKGASATGQDQDDAFLMPYTTVQKKIKGQYWLDDIICTAISADVLAEAEKEITALLRERHHIASGASEDFNLRHPVEIAEAVANSVKDMEMLLASIAAISLLVGGIGIMNTMLVSVTERTREIGIRMSVGARAFDIQRQFLGEALVISLAGGMIGILIGRAASFVITNTLHWPVRLSPNSVLLAFGFALSIGAFFGFYPAFKASRLDPVEALRFET